MPKKDISLDGDQFDEWSDQINHTGVTATASRRRLLHLLGAGGLASVAGCAGDNVETDELQNAAVALPEPPVTPVRDLFGYIQPYYTRIVEPLIWVTGGMDVEPWLATNWEATGEKTWEFTIREEVKFHNGESLTADEVVFSFKNYLEEKAWSQGFLNIEPEGVRKVDDFTVEFENTSQFPVYPRAIAIGSLAIQHPDAADTKHEVIGTGPFQVDEVKQDKYLRTTAFDEYWQGSPTGAELTFQDMEDPNTRVLSLKNEEIDVAFSPPKDQVESLRASDSIDILTRTAPRVGYFGINIYNSPTDELKLRKGLNYAVSQRSIVEQVLAGIGEPAKGPIAKIIDWSAHDSLPDYGPDKDRARELVEGSAYAGEPLKLGVSHKRTDNKLLAEAFQGMAEEVGITIDIEMMEEAAYDELTNTGDFHLRLMENGTRSASADYILFDLYHTEGVYNKPQYEENGTGLFNIGGAVDELIENGQQMGDHEAKKEVYEKAIQRIMENAVIVPLFNKEYVVAKRTDIQGLRLSPIRFNARWEGLERS